MHDLVRVPVDGPVGGKWKWKWFLNGGIHAEGLLVHGREIKIRDLEVQCYLFMLLGSTIFVDKSRDRLHPAINVFLKDLRRVAGYAWGVAALAYLYRQLGMATRVGSKSICDCLTLLQAWIYDYFSHFTKYNPKPLAISVAAAYEIKFVSYFTPLTNSEV
ncbi:unnamed protein product [Linum tenue]|nr:unnamed protein product [Linum tenue]